MKLNLCGMGKPYQLHHGKMEEVLKDYPENYFDSCVTDPPYALSFMNQHWDYQIPSVDQWEQVFRTLKPGGYLISFGGPRTYHRLVVNIEDAGFEIRDCIQWVFASGFPKSFNLDGEWKGWGSALKPAYEPICIARKPLIGTIAENVNQYGTGAINIDECRVGMRENNESGWSKTGAKESENIAMSGKNYSRDPKDEKGYGRWPANLIHDGSEEVVALFPESDGQQADVKGTEPSSTGDENTVCFGKFARVAANPKRGDSGSAARFFKQCNYDAEDTEYIKRFIYCPKTSREDRNEGCNKMDEKPLLWSSGTQSPGTFQAEGTKRSSKNNHPTVKPTELMRYLIRLVTHKDGICLDPFMGSGSTGKACMFEHIQFHGIDKTMNYLSIAEARIEFAIHNRDNQLFLFP